MVGSPKFRTSRACLRAYARAHLIGVNVSHRPRKKTQKKIDFCLRVKFIVYICRSNQQNKRNNEKNNLPKQRNNEREDGQK